MRPQTYLRARPMMMMSVAREKRVMVSGWFSCVCASRRAQCAQCANTARPVDLINILSPFASNVHARARARPADWSHARRPISDGSLTGEKVGRRARARAIDSARAFVCRQVCARARSHNCACHKRLPECAARDCPANHRARARVALPEMLRKTSAAHAMQRGACRSNRTNSSAKITLNAER